MVYSAMTEVTKWNVIFLVDKNPANKIILLRRSPDKAYAPNFYTGIGGKIGDLSGLEDESPLESAYRELSEETENELNKEVIKLTEFARCIYEDGLRLYYFYGLYDGETPPRVNPKDGELSWVNVKDLFSKEIIPTTKAVCEEWAQRQFVLNKPFTIYVKESGKDKTVRLVEAINVVDDLK
jgi:8-oxo-dGTP pyrophosphatase MutT (NUDIX family)